MRLRSSPVAATAVLLIASVLSSGPAQADDRPDPAPSGAPLTHPDRVTVASNGYADVDVLANDVDPDGPHDDLVVCRVEIPAGQPLFAQLREQYTGDVEGVDGFRPVLEVNPIDTPPGTYTVVYHACDYDYLTPASVTVTVTKANRVTAARVDARPGLVRFTNHSLRTASVQWGGPHQDHADGHVSIPAGAHRSVRVIRHRIWWEASVQHQQAGRGSLGSIVLPGEHPRPPARTATPDPSGRRVSAEAGESGETGETGGAPETSDDDVRLAADHGRSVDVLANDTDPDGDGLAICRVGEATPGLLVELSAVAYGPDGPTGPDVLSLGSSSSDEDLAPGTYTVTYWACDQHRLTPGTLTVRVHRPPRVHSVQAHQRRGHPGVVRFTNPNPTAVRVYYGGAHRERADGHLRLDPGQHRDVRVVRTTLLYLTLDRDGDIAAARLLRHLHVSHPGRHPRRADPTTAPTTTARTR